MLVNQNINNKGWAVSAYPAQKALQWVDECHGKLDVANIQTAAGNLALYARGDVLMKAEWMPSDRAVRHPERDFLKKLLQQVDQYWDGPYQFYGISLYDQGTKFRRRVWQALCAIPYGETITYMALAKRLDSSPRAIGGACRHNPYPLFIPCHRVVSTKGIGGYAGQVEGDFLGIKQRLLDHEAGYVQ